MTSKNRQPEPTSAEVYAARAADIARLIDLLEGELERHAGDFKEDPANWGRPGDLGKVRGDLIDLVSFMSGFDRAEVERVLAE